MMPIEHLCHHPARSTLNKKPLPIPPAAALRRNGCAVGEFEALAAECDYLGLEAALLRLQSSQLNDIELRRILKVMPISQLGDDISPLIFGMVLRLLRSDSQLDAAVAKRALRAMATHSAGYSLHASRLLGYV